MTLRDETYKLIWERVAQSPEQLAADVTGEPQVLDEHGVIALTKLQVDGLIDAVLALAVEIDNLKSS